MKPEGTLRLWIALVVVLVSASSARRRNRPANKESSEEAEAEQLKDPVIVTTLLEAGKLDEAQNATRVTPPLGGLESYAGFLTVNKQYNSNLFFWFFPADGGMEKAPLVLWLQGGPGSSSLFGLFVENGPFKLRKGRRLKRRKHAWTRTASMLYIDSPVGTGFSFTDSAEGYATSSEQVGQDLYQAMLQFYKLFPQLRDNEFFITGESYGGKYIPALGRAIHHGNPTAEQKINLKGMAIGNPLSDPESQMGYSDYLYQIGLVDDHGRQQLRQREELVQTAIREKNWMEAFKQRDNLIGTPNTTLFRELTGFKFRFNYLHDEDYLSRSFNTFVQLKDIRALLHVGNLTFHNRSQVAERLREDVMQSVRPWIEELLEHYDMLFFNGQLDVADPYPLMVNFLRHLEWSGKQQYLDARRSLWYVDGDLAGYSKTAGRLTEVLVRAAGHMVPTDQSKWALDLISKFVTHKPIAE